MLTNKNLVFYFLNKVFCIRISYSCAVPAAAVLHHVESHAFSETLTEGAVIALAPRGYSPNEVSRSGLLRIRVDSNGSLWETSSCSRLIN